MIIVTLDQDDTVIVQGFDTSGNRVKDYEMSNEEVAEHEIAGHGREQISDRYGDSKKEAVEAEDSFREKRGETFRRKVHDQNGNRVIPG